jgi:hypothetical protein
MQTESIAEPPTSVSDAVIEVDLPVSADRSALAARDRGFGQGPKQQTSSQLAALDAGEPREGYRGTRAPVSAGATELFKSPGFGQAIGAPTRVRVER